MIALAIKHEDWEVPVTELPNELSAHSTWAAEFIQVSRYSQCSEVTLA